MNTLTKADACQAYTRITGRKSKLTRLPRHHGTHAWEDDEGIPIIALWGLDSTLIGWRLSGTSFWLPDYHPA